MRLSVRAEKPPSHSLADLLLWLIAAFHILLVAALLVAVTTVSPANAADSACRGRDLLADLKSSDPAAYDRIMREGEATPNGQGVLWKIEKAGTAPSFLLGTMHVTDPRVLALPEEVRKAYEGAATVVVESDEILDSKKMALAFLARPELTMLPSGTTISSLLSRDDYASFGAALKARGIPAATLERMRPWLILSMVSLPPCEVAREASGTAFLDKKLAVDAVAAGKQVKGLETMIEQAESMASIPDAVQLKSLLSALKLGNRSLDILESMTDLYLARNSGALKPMLKAATADQPDDEGDAAFEDKIIVERNKRMVERALPMLDTGNVFIAVGFLHLPGRTGLIELLRAQGYTVTAVH